MTKDELIVNFIVKAEQMVDLITDDVLKHNDAYDEDYQEILFMEVKTIANVCNILKTYLDREGALKDESEIFSGQVGSFTVNVNRTKDAD